MRERQFVADMVKETYVPKMFRVKQIFPRPKIEPEEIPEIIRKLLNDEKFASRVKPGMRIAITAGSRGIANVALTTKCIADFVKSRGAYPFVVPAMGSHGGATAEGQKEILAGYGITEDYMECPIISSMEVKKIGVNEEGRDVFIDKNAAEADGIILGCRIKPHTAFPSRAWSAWPDGRRCPALRPADPADKYTACRRTSAPPVSRSGCSCPAPPPAFRGAGG